MSLGQGACEYTGHVLLTEGLPWQHTENENKPVKTGNIQWTTYNPKKIFDWL